MAQPKKKTSHQKQQSRRAHWKAVPQTIVSCLNCASPTRAHQVCKICGFYRGRPAHRSENISAE